MISTFYTYKIFCPEDGYFHLHFDDKSNSFLLCYTRTKMLSYLIYYVIFAINQLPYYQHIYITAASINVHLTTR